jgi:KAP-like P-loop domain-containing protein
MRRLADRVSRIDEATHDQTPSGFCRGIIQVSYNAWHYMGANQWLSLVEAIFGELERWQAKNPSHTGSAISIRTGDKLRQELVANLDRAQRVKAQAAAELEAAMAAHDEAVKDHAACVSRSKWTEVSERFRSHCAADANAFKNINRAGRILGLNDLANNSEQLNDVLEQGRTLNRRATLLTSSVKVRRYLGNLVVLLIISIVIGLVGVVMVKLVVTDPKTWVDVLGKGVAAISTIGGVLAGLAILFLRNRASKALEVLQTYDSKLRHALQQTDAAFTYNQAVATEKVADSQKQLHAARTRFIDAVQSELLARQELDDFAKGGILKRVSEYYRQLISTGDQDLTAGVVPIIREDFASLSESIEPTRRQRFEDEPAFNRIVIYIEDLDQCPPAVVITVLQAIYLLLAFPLFVVVVSANPLWLIECLKPQYLKLADLEGKKIEDESVTAALKFLAKLIQVPFWIEPMAREGAIRFVDQALMTGDTPASPGRADEDRDGEREFLERIAAVMDASPRDLKRLINSYRLLKLTARSGDVLQFEERPAKRSEFLGAITELALLIAAPMEARYVFEVLAEKTRSSNFEDFFRSLESNPRIAESAHWKVIRDLLKTYEQFADAHDALTDLRRWSQKAARHSFNVSPR